LDARGSHYAYKWYKGNPLKKIDFFKHNIGNKEIEDVTKVLHSIFLTNANITKTFEENFANYLQAQHCITVSSCTAALHLSLLALGIGKGDEVITTPLSFVATPNAILHAGATPVFVDVEKETGNIDANLIEQAITPKTKAIMPVHLYGTMCDMKKIHQIAQKYNLKIIEDAAHCIEGERDGIRVGELSDTACFSFYATKNITSGEGGAITTNDTKLAQTLYKLRIHGINKDASSRYTQTYQHWDMEILGWKYNISDIQSALLLNQLKNIEKYLQKREKVAQLYEKKLKKLKKVKLLSVPKHTKSARHLFTILVKKRDKALLKLQKKGIGVAVNYRAIHLLHYYKKEYNYKKGDFPIAEYIGERTLSIPLHPNLQKKEIKKIIKAVSKL